MQTKHLNYLFKSACQADIEAIKPGNVSIHSAGHEMQGEDFIKSAQACAEAICATQSSLGERIFDAVSATRKVVPMNTNLGIILLCAPLIQAVYIDKKQSLRESLRHVLANTNIDDARRAYLASALYERYCRSEELEDFDTQLLEFDDIRCTRRRS